MVRFFLLYVIAAFGLETLAELTRAAPQVLPEILGELSGVLVAGALGDRTDAVRTIE